MKIKLQIKLTRTWKCKQQKAKAEVERRTWASEGGMIDLWQRHTECGSETSVTAEQGEREGEQTKRDELKTKIKYPVWLLLSSVCLWVSLSVSKFVCLSLHLSVSLSFFWTVTLSIRLSLSLTVYLSFFLSFYDICCLSVSFFKSQISIWNTSI